MRRLGMADGQWKRAVLALAVMSWAAVPLSIVQGDKLPARKASPWENDIRRFEAWDRRNSYPADAVLFVGSSSIVHWTTREHFPALPVINRGFGGSQIADVNRFVDRIVMPYRPRVIVFYAGDNDIAAGKSPEQVVDDYRTFVARVRARLPRTPIIFIAIKPSQARWRLWPAMNEANQRIRQLSRDDPRLVFADIATPMLTEAGEPRKELFAPDGLHLNDEGYRLWTRVLTPLIESSLAKGRAAD